MGWTDRDYNQSNSAGPGGPLIKLLNGSIPLFRFRGIDVRMHASLALLIVLVLLFGLGQGFTWQDRVFSMSCLFGIVLLHEFGHCFTARWVGGEADLVTLGPLGGLAFARPPRRPLPTFLTVLGGPSVNVVLCTIAAIVLFSMGQRWSLNPFNPMVLSARATTHYTLVRGIAWFYLMAYWNLLFNLLPIFPLDGGQMLQTAVWPRMGYAKSMNFACTTGMVGAVILALWGIVGGKFLLVFIAISGFMTCLSLRMQLKSMGMDSEFAGEGSDLDFSESLKPDPPRRRLSPRAIRKAQKAVAAEHAEQDRVDAILAKVSAHGMNSLTWMERRVLHQATARKRKHEEELTRERR